MEQWTELRNQEETYLKSINSTKTDKLNYILNETKIDDDKWDELGSLLQIKRKGTIFNPSDDGSAVIEGFSKLYKDNGPRQNNLQTAGILIQIMEISLKRADILKNIPPLRKPYTKACDYQGYSQKWLHQYIHEYMEENNRLEELKNFQFMIKNIAKYQNNLIHLAAKVILFNKVDEPTSWSQLRPITIIPATLAFLEKLVFPLIRIALDGKISKRQYGFVAKRGCNHAKLNLYFNWVTRRHNFLLLIDVKKAFDSVNHEVLESKLKAMLEDRPEGLQLLMGFLDIYKNLQYEILGKTIYPTQGVGQGTTYGPDFFNIYINDSLNNFPFNAEDATIQAFADDIIVQAKDLKTLELTFEYIHNEFNNMDLSINYDKCELITSSGMDSIRLSPSVELHSKPVAIYLGQEVDCNFTPVINISNKNFGIIINVLTKCHGLTILAKIRIFKIFMQSKINHLIPLITISGKAKELWATVRKLIFKHILNRSTLPRESANNFGCSFYDIIMKPIVKLTDTAFEEGAEPQLIQFLKSICAMLAKTMIEVEPNHNELLAKATHEVLNNDQYYDSATWNNLIKASVSIRLWEDEWSEQTKEAVLRIKAPNIIHALSNATLHMIRENIIKYYKKEGDEKNECRKIIRENITKYLLCNHFLGKTSEIGFPKEEYHTNSTLAAEHYSIILLKAKVFLDTYIAMHNSTSLNITEEILTHTNPDEAITRANELVNPEVTLFRKATLKTNRSYDIYLETLLEVATRRIHLNTKAPNLNDAIGQETIKRRPGRPKMQQTTKHDSTNMKIDDFFSR